MTVDTDIGNRALVACGAQSQIASLGDGSPEANAITAVYLPCLRTALRAAQWNFAEKVDTLALLKAGAGTPEYSATTIPTTWNSTLPPPGWLYSYAYPNDCIFMRRLLPQGGQGFSGVPLFSIGTGGTQSLSVAYQGRPITWKEASDKDASGNPSKVILANETQALGVYTQLVTAPDVWADDFQDVMVAAIAGKIAYQLTGKSAMARERIQEANALIMEARVTNGNEGITVHNPQPDWMTVRDIGGNGASMGWQPLQYGPLFGFS